jgi:hypothetical protein
MAAHVGMCPARKISAQWKKGQYWSRRSSRAYTCVQQLRPTRYRSSTGRTEGAIQDTCSCNGLSEGNTRQEAAATPDMIEHLKGPNEVDLTVGSASLVSARPAYSRSILAAGPSRGSRRRARCGLDYAPRTLATSARPRTCYPMTRRRKRQGARNWECKACLAP